MGEFIDINALDPFSLESVTYEDRCLLPKGSGVYFALTMPDTVSYIGLSRSIRKRWGHHSKRKNLNLKRLRIAWLPLESDHLVAAEVALIERFKPPLNGVVLQPEDGFEDLPARPHGKTLRGATLSRPPKDYSDGPPSVDDWITRNTQAHGIASLLQARRDRANRLICLDPEIAEVFSDLGFIDGVSVQIRKLALFYLHLEARNRVIKPDELLKEYGITVCTDPACPDAQIPKDNLKTPHRWWASVEVFNALVPSEMQISV